MRNRLCLLVLLLVTVLVVPAASVPQVINYQGKLMQPSGAVVPTGNDYTMEFAIYASATTGEPLWSQTLSGVRVDNGLFAVTLGGVTNPIPDSVLSADESYLGISVNGDPEMTPRQRIASVIFAEMAGSVVDGAVTTSKLQNGAVTAEKLAPALGFVPIGSVIAWWGDSANISEGWQLCDGSIVSDPESPLSGKATPNLVDRFIKGMASTVYPTPPSGGSASIDLRHEHVVDAHGHTVNSHKHSIGADGSHDHGMNHQHSCDTGPGSGNGVYSGDDPDPSYLASYKGHNHTFTTGWTRDRTDGAGNHSHGGETGAVSPGTSLVSPGTNEALSSSQSILPPYVGLLYIVRIK